MIKKNNKFLVAAFILFFAINLTSFSFCFASRMVSRANQDSIMEGCGHMPSEAPVLQKSPVQSTENPVMPCCVNSGAETRATASGSQAFHSPKFYAVSHGKNLSFDYSIKNNPSSEIIQVIVPPPQEENLTSIFKKE